MIHAIPNSSLSSRNTCIHWSFIISSQGRLGIGNVCKNSFVNSNARIVLFLKNGARCSGGKCGNVGTDLWSFRCWHVKNDICPALFKSAEARRGLELKRLKQRFWLTAAEQIFSIIPLWIAFELETKMSRTPGM